MRRSLLHSRRLRCFFEADSRTPFRHSPLREETAFREKPHFPCKGSSPPLFLLPSRRNSSPAVRPPSLSAAYRRSASTQPATHRKPCFRHDVFASRPSFQPEHRSIRLEKPCIETVHRNRAGENLQERSVPYPFLAPLPTSHASDRRRPGPGQKRSLAKYRKALFSGFPTNRLRPQPLRSRALPAGASDEHRRGNGRKESKEGFPCEKIGKPTDHPSPNLPTNVRDFELPQSRILRMPEFRCVPNRKPSGKAPLRNTVKPLRSSGRTTKRFRFRVAQTEFFPLPGPADRAPNRSRREALRSTESRPDPPAARRTISGSGLRKPSLSFEGTFPDEIRTGSRRRVPRQDGKRSASPDRQQPSPSEHAPLRKTCAPREHNGSRGARVIRRTARDRSRHRPVALRSGSVRS